MENFEMENQEQKLLNQKEEVKAHEFITFDGSEPETLNQLPFYEQVYLTKYDEYLMTGNYVPVIEKVDTVRLTNDISIDVYGDINEPWFLGQDVARIMDYKQIKPDVFDVSMLTSKLSEYDCTVFNVQEDGTNTIGTISEFSRMQQKLFISEAGIYQLFAVSRKPHVKEYYRILVGTLQNIRRATNEYVVTENTYMMTTFKNVTAVNSRYSVNAIINGALEAYDVQLDILDINQIASKVGIIELDDKGHILSYNKILVNCSPYHNNVDEPIFYTINYFRLGALELIGSYIFEHYYVPKTYKK